MYANKLFFCSYSSLENDKLLGCKLDRLKIKLLFQNPVDDLAEKGSSELCKTMMHKEKEKASHAEKRSKWTDFSFDMNAVKKSTKKNQRIVSMKQK